MHRYTTQSLTHMLTHSTCIHTCKHTNTHSHVLTLTLAYSCTYTYCHTCSLMHKLIQSHTLTLTHTFTYILHFSVAQAQPPPVWQFMPPEQPRLGLIWCVFALFSLLVLFIFLSHDEHIWRRIYFHPIWKHISPQPWARQISEEAPGPLSHGLGRLRQSQDGDQRAPRPEASWSGLLPSWVTLNSGWLLP